jgi:hypothetical protein
MKRFVVEPGIHGCSNFFAGDENASVPLSFNEANELEIFATTDRALFARIVHGVKVRAPISRRAF